jgi:hypothetical protein
MAFRAIRSPDRLPEARPHQPKLFRVLPGIGSGSEQLV